MAQAFVTTYQNHYRWNVQERVKCLRTVDPYGIVLPMDESWIKAAHVPVNQQELDDENQLIDEKLLKKRKDLLRSVYQVDYTQPHKEHRSTSRSDLSKDTVVKSRKKDEENHETEYNCEEDGVGDNTDNELLNYGRTLYEPKLPLPKVLGPLVGTRKLFGYIRPSQCYTPLTVYQKYYGKVGFNVLKDNYLAAKAKFCGRRTTETVAAGDANAGPVGKKPKVEKKRNNKCEECCTCCPCYRGKL